MRTVMLALTIGLVFVLAGVSARAGLIDPSVYLTKPSFSNPFDATSYVANPSFETPPLSLYTGSAPDNCNYQQALPTGWSGGWSDTSAAQNQNSLRHYRPGTNGLKSNGGYFWDPTDGVNGAGIILRHTVPAGWMYQSLGTVAEEDIGWIFIAQIDSSNRDGMTSSFDGERRISFRTDVTSDRGGDIGDLVSLDLPSATRRAGGNDPWHTLTDWFQPTADDLGKEIFLVFSVQEMPPGTSPGQYHFDNVRLWVVPEPTATILAVMGLLGVLCCTGQRRRGHDAR